MYCQVSDCLEFLPTDNGSIQFLWLSESSGNKHIYLIEAIPPSNFNGASVPRAQCTAKIITSGAWNILGPKVLVVCCDYIG